MNKVYISANDLLEKSYQLAMQVIESGYRPTFIIAVWRGGTPIGIALQELLEVCGIKANHIAIRTSSYSGINQRKKTVEVYGLSYAVKTLNEQDRVLIVDDVHDSGLSVEELRNQINNRPANPPKEIKVATVYYKPNKSQVDFKPDFYLEEVDDWLVFPHELAGLSIEELGEYKPGLGLIKNKLLKIIEKN